ncbi:MAG: ParA family protein [Actinomycetaceae bacterium]|nr:ParA family protein [Actinomycetaceae bacterium]
MITIATANPKGGVGKSTTVFHLARAAHVRGMSVIVVDMDPKGDISAALAPDRLVKGQPGVADALSSRSQCALRDVLVKSLWDRVTLAPSGDEALEAVRDELLGAQVVREKRLATQLASVESDYDLCLIDCPPSLDQLTINALTAANGIAIVTQPKLWSASGIAHLLDTIEEVRANHNPRLRVSGVVVNMHEPNTVSGGHWLRELSEACTARSLPQLAPPLPRKVVISDCVECSLGLDEWPPPQVELLQVYSRHLDSLVANARTDGVEKVTLRLPSEVVAEARAAWWTTSMTTQTRSFSAWVAAAIETKLMEDRETFNGGQAFAPLPPGQIPTGRR